jgi:RNA polymerase sigma-70 factor, ECF subfamily
MTSSPSNRARDLEVWQAERPRLLSLAYRMLGDWSRAEDMVQDAWLRWTGRTEEADEPAAYLVAIVTRLCLNELSSARSRNEESRSDRLPEPVNFEASGLFRVEAFDDVSMALLVMLQRLTPAERAVLLLHDVFDLEHARIAELVGKTPAASRKLLERARASVAEDKRLLEASRDEHARLLQAFFRAARAGDVATLESLLADDAILTTDGGREGRAAGGVANLRAPLQGAKRVAAFVASTSPRGTGGLGLVPELRELNGRPAIVLRREGEPFGAVMLAVADGKIHRIYFQADPARLRRVGEHDVR